ncbi:MAG: ribokinase [Acidimicrobiales bacterium]|nr:ribokinase [Acidimicrobiales bacterium]MDP6298589.1 ribokinase [Acidimicrobiales bacterium]HJM29103.1 ribokinase [Acidimicrobiales bacterium]
MSIDIAVVGSCNLDLVVNVENIPKVGQTVLGGDLSRIPGGKGANQAVAAARLGYRSSMIGRVGDDETGIFLRECLEKDGVETTSLLVTAETPSGIAMIAVQNDGDNSIVVSPGANAHLTPEDIAEAQTVSNATIVLTQAEIPIETVLAAARNAKGTFVWNPAPAPEEIVPLELLDLVDVLIPNQTELSLLAGTGAIDSVEKAVEAARTLPCASVVVTLGADGAVVVVNNDAVHVPAPKVNPIDTTGAGDAFCAALCGGLSQGSDFVAAVSEAVRVGAATTLVAGAQSSFPTSDQVNARLENR